MSLLCAKHSHIAHVLSTATIHYLHHPYFGCDGDDGAEVFSSRTAPSTGGASQESGDSDSGVDVR
jgi:hypothetical protein